MGITTPIPSKAYAAKPIIVAVSLPTGARSGPSPPYPSICIPQNQLTIKKAAMTIKFPKIKLNENRAIF
jgi:hypothetical protein